MPTLVQPGRPALPDEMIAAAAGDAAAAAPAVPAGASLAKLLTSHILRDGELILLILRPSLWFIPLACIQFIAAVLLLSLCAFIAANRAQAHGRVYLELAFILIFARLMVAALQWMGRLYILTELRVIRLSGVFSVDVFDCPLRKVLRTRLVSHFREKCLGVGSIEIIPYDDAAPSGVWQTVAHPLKVHDQLVAAINRAKQSGLGGE
jgi:hypothetical protein